MTLNTISQSGTTEKQSTWLPVSRMPIPCNVTFYLLGGIALVALLAGVWPALLPFWQLMLLVALLVLVLDALASLYTRPPQLERQVAGSLALGISSEVVLRISNPNRYRIYLLIFDHYPQQVNADGLPAEVRLEAAQKARIRYRITPHERGKLSFPLVQVRVRSLFGFWLHEIRPPVQSEMRVYPNFAAISHYALLATDNNLSRLGIIKKRRRGEGQDFHQLREYREGDSLRQIDWKATARMQKIISREYQDERDQEIIFLLDCGQRMLAKDGELSHFDHTLNALLLLSYVALRQGDAVGMTTFSTDNQNSQCWLPPRKGQHQIQTILNTVYDLQAGLQTPDYTKVASELLARHSKRALVILLSTIRDEDMEDILPAVRLLRRRHLVLVANLRENAIDKLLEKPLDSLERAIDVAATHRFQQFRRASLERLEQQSINLLDVRPESLNVALINAYLAIKRGAEL